MFPAKSMTRLLAVPVVLFLTTGRLPADLTGPTLHLSDDGGKPLDNPLCKFMYFVPLISPDPIAVSTNAGNSQQARVVSASCQTNGTAFHAVCNADLPADIRQAQDGNFAGLSEAGDGR